MKFVFFKRGITGLAASLAVSFLLTIAGSTAAPVLVQAVNRNHQNDLSYFSNPRYDPGNCSRQSAENFNSSAVLKQFSGGTDSGSYGLAGRQSAVPSAEGRAVPAGSGRASSMGKDGSAGNSYSGKIIVGYFGGWAAYEGYTPDKIIADNLDVLNYAFAKIGDNLEVEVGDPDVDYENFRKLKQLKTRYPRLKTVLSIGGWQNSGNFSDAALTDSSRRAFAESAVVLMKNYGFDGLDIDWEYPTGNGLPSNKVRPSDRTDFGLLLKTVRARLDEQEKSDGKHYILSFAGGAGSSFAENVGLSGIADDVDYGYIMAYDLHGGWDTYTDFNAPLYLPAGNSPQYKASVDENVKAWLDNGFPAQKLILGVPFYGYSYIGTTNIGEGLWQKFSSAAAVGYDTIKAKYLSNPSFVREYSVTARVAWLFNGSDFISYDDEESIHAKAQYAQAKNLLGVGAWDLSYDRSGALLKIINDVVKK